MLSYQTKASFRLEFPTFYITGTRSFGCIPRSNRRQLLCTIVGETLGFLFGFFCSFVLIMLEVLTGQNFEVVVNMVLIVVSLIAAFSMQFSLILFTDRELFVSMMMHIFCLESYLYSGKYLGFIKFVIKI
jgi:hypothetical protein